MWGNNSNSSKNSRLALSYVFMDVTMTKQGNLEMKVSVKVGWLPYAVGSRHPYPWLILEENGHLDDDDDDGKVWDSTFYGDFSNCYHFTCICLLECWIAVN